MKTFNEYINEKKEDKFNKQVEWTKRYPEVRDLFTYAGNIQELDALKSTFDNPEQCEKKYDKDVIDFFYNERKKNLLYGDTVNKSDDINDPDGDDMKGRANCDLFAKLVPTNRPNF